MKDILRQERGVSLISLAAAIIIIGIITTMLLYSISDTNDIDKLTKMYTDIDNLGDKISNYYSIYGKIPAISNSKLSGATSVINALTSTDDNPVGANDTGDFLVIDLQAIENLTLNYGKDYEKLKEQDLTGNIGDLRDLYVINENSHNIFYLKGISVKNGNKTDTYYTNQDRDTEKVDIRYVDGIKIYDGYNYVSGNKASGIVIGLKGDESSTATQYTWINVDREINSISDLETTIVINASKQDEFIESVNGYKGYYKNSSNEVLYFSIDDSSAWSVEYDEEGRYTDKSGNTAYIPKGFQVSRLASMNTIDKGLVIRNASNTNEKYVWIDVPEQALQDANGNIAVTLEEVENNLLRYVSGYRQEGYLDEYYEGCGITVDPEAGGNPEKTYNDLKNKLYQSIKDKGGFWVSTDKSSDQKSCALAYQSNISNINGRTKCLLFGIQWDLMCRFLDETDLNNIKNLVGDGEMTLESTSTNSKTSASGNLAVKRGTTKIDDRNTINYDQSAYYRTTIF